MVPPPKFIPVTPLEPTETTSRTVHNSLDVYFRTTVPGTYVRIAVRVCSKVRDV